MDLKAEKKTLKSLLAIDEQQFRIPPYQRPYSWTSEQVDDLWEDLRANVETGHFLGSIVMSVEDESHPLIIDGQQRLTTLMLLMAVLRDECVGRGLERAAQQIDKRLCADDLAEGDAYFKFRTGAVNWPVFRDFVLRSPTDSARRDDVTALPKDDRARNRALLDNLTRLRTAVRSHLETLGGEARSGWLTAFSKNLVERVELVAIEVANLSDAFLLFETLNDRGLSLSAADLLKSHLLGDIARRRGEEDVDEASAEWDAMLDDLGPSADVPRFLRHYLLGESPRVKKDEIFGRFKDLIKQRGPDHVLAGLRTAARDYGEFESPQKVAHAPTRRVLVDLQTLRAVTCYIALLPARRSLSENDFVDFARLAEVLTFRYSSVVGLGTNDLERRYHEAARALAASPPDLARARQALIAAMPDSHQFQASFERLSMGRQYLVRYALARIEEHLSPAAEMELRGADAVHIEHVMPQTLNDAWRLRLGADVERHAEYVNRWGNLTLFYSGLNIPASNKDFPEKVAYYERSQVKITRDLGTHETWGPEQIELRQRALAELAERIWAIPLAGPSSARGDGTLARFRVAAGEWWPHVEPLVVETSAIEIQAIAEELPRHLADHITHASTARELARRLENALAEWESLGSEERAVLHAAVAYFLQHDDAVVDSSEGGLVDDRAVIEAALQAISPRD